MSSYVIHDIFDIDSMLTFACRGKPQTNPFLERPLQKINYL